MSLERAVRTSGRGRASRWSHALLSRSRHIPLRVKLVLLTCALVTGALISTGFAATNLLRHSLMNRVDSQLISASHLITPELPRRAGRGPGTGTGATPPASEGAPTATAGTASSTPCASTESTDTTTETRPRLPSPYRVRTRDTAGTPPG